MVNTNIRADFTLDELLGYLRAGDGNLEGYRTMLEWATHFSVTPARMTNIMHQAQTRGILLVQRAGRQRLDGIISPVPVYAFVLEQP